MAAHLPNLFLLHGLGGSARAFDAVARRLSDEFDIVAIDLPGFGDSADARESSVRAMVDAVCDAIRRRDAPAWALVGHSMGGKVASIVAARAVAGQAGLVGLKGVVLLAGSPPTPEPMEESRRRTMLTWVQHGHIDEASARTFIAGNTGSPLQEACEQRAIADLRRTSPAAWRAWLEDGSKEDWSAQVGVLNLPALIIVGSEDGDLGETGQRVTNLRVYPRAKLLSEAGAGHLLPLERPVPVAEAIRRFWFDDAVSCDGA